MKLSRILSNQNGVSRKQANALIAAGRVTVNDTVCTEASMDTDRFATVAVDGSIVQHGTEAHKPAGYLSATEDKVHPTVLDLIAPDLRSGLHIAGRLDRATTGLLILTNNGTWSRGLTDPKVRIPKVYLVTTAYPMSPETADRFAEGIWFEYEQLTTSPAHIELIDATNARLTIYEGRYHQVKRMFHAVGNRVVSLHRERMGAIALDGELQPGEYRALNQQETQSIPSRSG